MRFILFISVVLFMNAAAFAQTDPTPKIAPGSDADLQSTCAGNVSMRTVKNGTWTKPTIAQLLVMANGQDVDAIHDLCTCYHTREAYEESLYWCKSASAKGDVGAQNMVAYMLRMGQGTPADPRAAFALYQQAAKNSLEKWKGKDDADVYSGRVGKNVLVGQLRVMAAGYDTDAKYDLCIYHVLKEKYNKALEWCNEALVDEDDEALMMLAEMHKKGLGTPVDINESYEFYGRAALNGYAPAGKIMFEAFLNGKKPIRKSKEWAWYFLTVSGAAAESEELKKRSLAIAATIKPEDMEKMLENIEHWRGVQQRMREHTEKKKRQYARP